MQKNVARASYSLFSVEIETMAAMCVYIITAASLHPHRYGHTRDEHEHTEADQGFGAYFQMERHLLSRLLHRA